VAAQAMDISHYSYSCHAIDRATADGGLLPWNHSPERQFYEKYILNGNNVTQVLDAFNRKKRATKHFRIMLLLMAYHSCKDFS
jgi:hypothetical protein